MNVPCPYCNSRMAFKARKGDQLIWCCPVCGGLFVVAISISITQSSIGPSIHGAYRSIVVKELAPEMYIGEKEDTGE